MDANVDRAWRRFALTLAGTLLFVAVTFLVATLFFLTRINSLEGRVAGGDQQTECRSRIAAAAETVRAERDSLGWQSLVDRFVSGQSAGLEDRAAQMKDLNRRLLDATDRRAHAIELCAQDPTYTPPS